MPVAVWANGPETHGVVCTDARLTDRAGSSVFSRDLSSTDQDYGQTGWDIGLNFSSLKDLAARLTGLLRPKWVSGVGTRIERGEVRRLAIHTHGVSGQVFVNGREAPPLTASATPMHGDLHSIGLMTPDDAANPAVILFVGCLAGQGRAGTELLSALSRVWPNRKVVGYASLGYAPGGRMLRSNDGCVEPGMRDTEKTHVGEADDAAGKLWSDRNIWPWASESSPRAKVAMNGAVISGANW